MRDFTLRFSDKADFRAFLRKLNWEEDEELQNAVLVDEIGFTFRETDVSDDGEPEYTRNEGYFVNIRLLDDQVLFFKDFAAMKNLFLPLICQPLMLTYCIEVSANGNIFKPFYGTD